MSIFALWDDVLYSLTDAATQTNESDHLRVIVDMLMTENATLKAEVRRLEEQLTTLHDTSNVFEDMKTDEKKLIFYCGLPSLSSFMLLLRLLTVAGFLKFRNLSAENTLLMILMKLKLGLTNRDIGYRFRVSPAYVSAVLSSRLTYLAAVSRQLIVWPSQEAIFANMPTCFTLCSGNLRWTRVILDCFEIRTERPKSLVPRAKLWSNYKAHSTVKILIGISPAGAVTFVSDAWGGRATDKMITLESDLMHLLDSYDVVLADRGFLVREELAVHNIIVVTPHFTKGKKQLTRREVQESRRISRVRIHVERVIGRIRRNFRILNGVLPLALVPQIDNIIATCCGLVNLHKGIVA